MILKSNTYVQGECMRNKIRYYKMKKEKKKNGTLKNIGIIISATIGILLLLYISIAVFFLYHFFPGTIIRNKDFSWKSSQDVEKYYEQLTEQYVLRIVDKDQNTEVISGSQIGLTYHSGKEIKNALKAQNPFLWCYKVFQAGKIDIPVTVRYDSKKLNEEIAKLTVVTQEQTEPVSAMPVYENGKFIIKEGTYGTAMDFDKLNKKISEYISTFQSELNLLNEKCYKQPSYTAQSSEVLNACERMNTYCNLNFSYDFGDNVKISGEEIAKWLTLDEEMNVVINEDAVKSWVSNLAEKYNTVGTKRSITTPEGKNAQVTGGTYGWEIDEAAEVNELLLCLKEKKGFSRKPVYKEGQTAASYGAQDWGTTYVEVDLAQQYMWYIENGDVKLEAPVVTGLPRDGRETPEGVYSILEMMKNKVLRGSIDPATGQPSYEQPVSYWMRITWSGIGFHDANWQEQFGGTWYIEHGSHGCINMRPKDAANLYKLIDYGTPAVVHY